MCAVKMEVKAVYCKPMRMSAVEQLTLFGVFCISSYSRITLTIMQFTIIVVNVQEMILRIIKRTSTYNTIHFGLITKNNSQYNVIHFGLIN